MRYARGIAAVLAALGVAASAPAEVVRETDPETGLVSWRWQGEALSLELVQRLPDQSRAFFLGRGFERDNSDAIAAACIFQTILRNEASGEGGPTLRVDLNEWRVVRNEKAVPPRLEKQWEPRWEETGASQAARVAFRWSLFPSRQQFEPGDYNWGMIPFGPGPGERFDLRIVWHEDGETRRGVMRDLRCAPDVADPRKEEPK
ncbi:MAG TPA: hypothetical protein VKA64_10420 [Gammaproteobacteria bacterium]|nr:hypothetical protein [Gammaproteobacteria bacterium]